MKTRPAILSKVVCRRASIFAAVLLAAGIFQSLRAEEVKGTGPLPPSPAIPENVIVKTDVAYGTAGGQSLLADLYLPKQRSKPTPAIIFIHGGGWVVGDKRQVWPVYLDFVKEGFAVLSIDYRLKAPYPAAVEDCQRAVRWLRSRAQEYNIDPEKFGAIGQSAGGHLASLLGLTEAGGANGDPLERYSSQVQAVVNQFGPTQISAGDFGYGIPFPYDDSCHCLGTINHAASPYYLVTSNAAPFLLIQGGRDPTVNPENMICFARALYRANVEVSLVIWPNTGHGNGNFDAESWQESIRFFHRHLK